MVLFVQVKKKTRYFNFLNMIKYGVNNNNKTLNKFKCVREEACVRTI